MARIPESELARLKATVSVERLAVAAGVKLTRQGKELVGRCPFHEDRTPSLSIDPEQNVWRCFGACDAGGSVVDWVMRVEGVSFSHAVALLRSAPSALTDPAGEAVGPVPKRTTRRKLPGLASADADDQAILVRVVDHYRQALKASPEALAYLTRRGLTNPQVVDYFRLGYADRTLAYRLPEKGRRDRTGLRSRLQALGVLRASGHEHLAGSLVVPLYDAEDRVVQMYGRKLLSNLRKGTPAHLYLPGAQRGVFNPQALRAHRDVILCESLVDAMTFWSAGLENVTTTYGAGGIHEDLWAALRRSRTQRVLIAYDRDEAGERGATKVAAELTAAGIAAYRIQFPREMDANEVACQAESARESLTRAMRNAVWLGEGNPPGAWSVPVRKGAEKAGPALPAEGSARAAEEGTTRAGGEEPASAEETAAAKPGAGSQAEVPLEEETACRVPMTAARAAGDAACPLSKRDADAIEVEVAATVPPSEATRTSREPLPARQPLPFSAAVVGAAASGANAPPAGSWSAGPALPAPQLPVLSRLPVPSPVPLPSIPSPRPPDHPPLTREGEDLWMRFGDRSYRVRDLDRKAGRAALRVSLRAAREDGRNHLDQLDLGVSKPRHAFIKQAAEELSVPEEVVKREVGLLVLALEGELDAARAEPAEPDRTLSDAEREAALSLLRSPDLLDQVLVDFQRCGVVGEVTNKLVGYLTAVSRRLERPLAVVIQSSSAAGKSSLQDAVLAFMPPEEVVRYSAMTGQSLFYMGETNLAGKILAIAEEEGAARASYALKLLQSEGELTIASTGKDPVTGRLVTHEYRVEGPVTIFLTTTAIEMDEELLNRCLVLSVDESREQTRAIHRAQREEHTLEGLLARLKRPAIRKRHQDAQRLLRPLLVANPYAEELTFLDYQTRSRRDHTKYLTLIRSLALLHQYQREVKTVVRDGQEVAYVEVTRADIEVADRLAREALGPASDELPAQSRRLLDSVVGLVRERAEAQGIARREVRFTRREVRERTGMGLTQTQVHMQRLEAMEYLLAHGGGAGMPRVYELLYQEKPEDEAALLRGLLEVRKVPGAGGESSPSLLDAAGNLPGPAGGVSGGCRADIGGVPVAWRTRSKSAESPSAPDFEASPPRRQPVEGTNPQGTGSEAEAVVVAAPSGREGR